MKNSENYNENNENVSQHAQYIEMEKYQKLIELAESIHHEINNPLTSIIGNVELMLMKNTDMDEQMEKKLRVVLKESRRMEEIIKKLRHFNEIANQIHIE